MTDSAHTAPSPLARALAAQAEAQIADLARARGLSSDTFAALAERADLLIERLADTTDPAGLDVLRDRRATLRAAARLLADPGASEIPPPNDAIYGATLDVTELDAIARALHGGPGGSTDRLLAHVSHADADAGRRDRVGLAFAAVCRRAGIGVRLDRAVGQAVRLEVGRWPISAAAGVPLDLGEVVACAVSAEGALRSTGRPGVIVLEAGAVLGWTPLRVIDDSAAVSHMNDRLDAWLLEAREGVAGAIGRASHAFGLVVHATLPATNVASRRLLFAECFRAVNLGEERDGRLNGFRAFAEALGRAGTPRSGAGGL